ncbi:MAG TPA: gamma-glutamyltransferase family protein [Candidatus Limnocylindrales bacterium]
MAGILARGARGAVVAPHALATAAGLRILAAGGHAVDAAIATNAVLAVVMPNGCGLGGDAFWLVWDEAAGEQVGLNGSGWAPAGCDPDRLREQGIDRIPLRGPLPVTVPGAVRSWAEAHRRWGRLSREAVLGPAVEQASVGFPAWVGLIDAVEATSASVAHAPWGEGFRAVWRPADRPWRPGERVRLPALAGTLTALAADGFDTFYDGALGERLVGGLVRAGAPFALDDLRAYQASWTTPVSTTYRGIRVTSHPPNSSGLVALELLNAMARFAPPSGARFTPAGWSAATWPHVLLEAAKLAYAERDRYLADPAFVDVPVDRLLSESHAMELAARISPSRADQEPAACRTLVGGTIYLGVVDPAGNAVSLIQSNASGFGSGVLDPVTGVHFHNRGASFSLDPSHVNVMAPRKRPAHTLLPGMLFREGERRPWIVAGSMGGDIQPQIHAAFVSAVVDAGADIGTAVAAPRVTVEPDGWLAAPTRVLADGSLAPGVEADLVALGHTVARVPYDGSLGHEHAIELVDGGPAAGGSLAAATDPRSAGLPSVL